MEEIMKEGERKRKKERSGGKDGKRVSKEYTCAYLLFFFLSLSHRAMLKARRIIFPNNLTA